GRFVKAEREHERELAQRAETGVRFATLRAARLQSYMDVLEAQVAGDVAACAREFPERRVRFERPLGGGFSVRREHYPEVHLLVTPNEHEGVIHVQYVFAMETVVRSRSGAWYVVHRARAGPPIRTHAV